jgi:beta-glucosidase/6-phospho-beta-glucosidase/beta-galactosidase
VCRRAIYCHSSTSPNLEGKTSQNWGLEILHQGLCELACIYEDQYQELGLFLVANGVVDLSFQRTVASEELQRSTSVIKNEYA